MQPDLPGWLSIATGACGERGLFSRVAITAGARVFEVKGALHSSTAVPPDAFCMQVGRDLWLCSDGAEADDLVNHSCAPNLGFVCGDAVLYALRDIAPGEELSWDYSTSIDWPGWRLDCRCGSERCRGVVRTYGELPSADRERLSAIALDYLRERRQPESS